MSNDRRDERRAVRRAGPAAPQRRAAPVAEATAHALAGDPLAFDALARRYASRLRDRARAITRSETDAEDALQDALVVIWQRLPEVTRPERLYYWMLRIVANKAIDLVRAQRVTEGLESIAERESASRPDDAVELARLAETMHGVLGELPELQRRAWLLRETEEWDYARIGVELGVPTSTVRGLLVRARRTVSSGMDDWR
jgi:RNA polymerase sigma-70 factor, ECF subfamily